MAGERAQGMDWEWVPFSLPKSLIPHGNPLLRARGLIPHHPRPASEPTQARGKPEARQRQGPPVDGPLPPPPPAIEPGQPQACRALNPARQVLTPSTRLNPAPPEASQRADRKPAASPRQDMGQVGGRPEASRRQVGGKSEASRRGGGKSEASRRQVSPPEAELRAQTLRASCASGCEHTRRWVEGVRKGWIGSGRPFADPRA